MDGEFGYSGFQGAYGDFDPRYDSPSPYAHSDTFLRNGMHRLVVLQPNRDVRKNPGMPIISEGGNAVVRRRKVDPI